MIQTFQIPSPPPQPSDHSYPGFRNWALSYGDRLLNYFNHWEGDLSRQFNTLLNGYGLDIASATTITVKNAIHQVTGSTTVQTINQPTGQTAVGVLTLYAVDGFSLGSSGNIMTPGGVPQGTAIMLAYHPAQQFWVSNRFSRAVFIKNASTDSPYTVPTNSYLRANGDNQIFTVNLPASPGIGDTVTVKRAVTSSFGVSVTTTDGSTIDGAASQNVGALGAFQTYLYATLGQWDIIG